MSQFPGNSKKKYDAVEELTGKMLKKMGFMGGVGQEVFANDFNGVENFWIHGIELEVAEEGSTTGFNYLVNLEDLPLEELLNKVNEKTATPFAEGTVLTFDASVPSGDYRIPPGKVKKRGTVVGIKVVVHDPRLRGASFDPQFLKTKQSSTGGSKRKRRNRRRSSRSFAKKLT